MAKGNTTKRVSLIEVLMVILIVGIAVIMILPNIADKQKRERIAAEVYPMFDAIQKANEEFNTEFGEYAFDITQLNLPILENAKFFEFAVTDSTLTATTTRAFGRPGAIIIYNFIDNEWSVDGTKHVIDKTWLP